jgi:hypothetical protein
MIAKVARDLHQALLAGGVWQHARIGRVQEPLAREFEHRVVCGTGPGEEAAFRFRLNLSLLWVSRSSGRYAPQARVSRESSLHVRV